ncbi:MAG TPA: hypothetical protein VK674_02375 [Candidatus Limnocylindria bacterium]|nr:hypothetical protein [Candidatus Limnocylindria bacterium]
MPESIHHESMPAQQPEAVEAQPALTPAVRDLIVSPEGLLPRDQAIDAIQGEIQGLQNTLVEAGEKVQTPGFRASAEDIVDMRGHLRELRANEEPRLNALREAWTAYGGEDIEEAQTVTDSLDFRSDAYDHVTAKTGLRDAKDTFYANLQGAVEAEDNAGEINQVPPTSDELLALFDQVQEAAMNGDEETRASADARLEEALRRVPSKEENQRVGDAAENTTDAARITPNESGSTDEDEADSQGLYEEWLNEGEGEDSGVRRGRSVFDDNFEDENDSEDYGDPDALNGHGNYDDTESIQLPDQTTERRRGPRQWLHNRWNSIQTRAAALKVGDLRHAFGDDPESHTGGNILTRKRIKQAAILGAAALATYWTATGKIDLNPGDNDQSFWQSIDISPVNDDSGQVPQYALEHQGGYGVFRGEGVTHDVLNNVIDNPDAFGRMSKNPKDFNNLLEWTNNFASDFRNTHPGLPDQAVEAATRAAAEAQLDKLNVAS